MQPTGAQIDPDRLLRDAIASVAVSAFSRGITIFAHVGTRMPTALVPELGQLDEFLHDGLERTIRAGSTRNIALTLWLTGTGPDGTVEGLLEVCRALEEGVAPATRLADLWTLPSRGGTARAATARSDPVADVAQVALRFAAVPGAPPVGARSGDVLKGRRLLHVGGLLFDQDRLRVSLADLGVEVGFVATSGEAMAHLRAAGAEGRPVDVLALNGMRMGDAAIDLAREVRGTPGLEATRLALTTAPRSGRPAPAEAALFDILPWAATPWRRLLDILIEYFRDQDAEAATAGGGGEAVAIPDLSGRRILIAEDAATNQVMLRAVLTRTGAEVEIVSDGAALVARHREAPGDLILMDLQMPGMGGMEALRQIRALDGPAAQVRVVAQTAYARETDRRTALAAGMDAYVVKPIVVAELYGLLNRLLSGS